MGCLMRNGKLRFKHQSAFTFIELMMVMAMIATIISIAMPRYFDGYERTKETALKQNLKEIREAIDHYHEDKGSYPLTLESLVTERYLRFIPIDPETDSPETWQLILSSETDGTRGITDIASGATTFAKDGTPYSSW